MKFAALLLLLLFAAPLLHAQAPQGWPVLKLANGTEYTDVKVSAVEPGGLKVMHASGVARIPYELLPEEIQKQFAFDPAKATEHRKAMEEQQRAALSKMSEERAREAQKAREKAELAKLEWQYMVVKIGEVVPGGLICYRHTQGGVVGSAAQAVNAITGGSNVVASSTDWSTPLFVEGVKGKHAEGDVLTGYAARHGVKEFQGRTLQRFVAKPDDIPVK